MDSKEKDVLAADLRLRDVIAEDLPLFFEQQLDPLANTMAAFTAKDPADREKYFAHWNKILLDPAITVNSILYQEQLVGHVSSFDQFGHLSVGYWLGRKFWGLGIATAALAIFLETIDTRPLHARVAKDNSGSIRVLQKNGFAIVGEDKGYANARNQVVEEYIMRLV